MKRGNKVLQLRIESRRRTRHIYIYIYCAAAGLNLRKLTMEGGLNLRKYIYVGGRLKPPEVEVPPGSYLPPVGSGSQKVREAPPEVRNPFGVNEGVIE